MAVGATHYELYFIGALCLMVIGGLGVMFKETLKIQSRNGKRIRGEKLL